ncbi:hypothetical protein [Roseobacter sp. CCS2]|uniref:hypothetical protein n=1 Tax=Roseobacter sp. CCS2 TaxID=391593 RepID=UPI0000F402A1|nr:hypothetical protein [Roseobacter sp. CCS2]EBA13210.1 hypothetical protein RCCS2_04974 [Roseobacter sp. CCS2]
MKRGRFSFLLFLLILTGPVIALNFGGANLVGWISERAGAFTPQAPIVAQEVAPEDIPQDPFQWLNDRPALRDVFIPNELTAARYVSVEKIMTPEALLTPGETLPDNRLLGLYAAARAPAQLMGYCADVVATIGASCDIIHAEARENREGKWVMNGRLAYIPAADLGTPESVENGQLISTKVLLPFEGDLRPANVVQSRINMLRQAQAACDMVRNQLGNCVLTQLTLDVHELWITDLEPLPAGTNPQRVEATAEFTVYADPLEFDQAALADLVASIVNPT